MKNTNHARLMRPRVIVGFATGFIGGACAGFLAGSIMFLQGNIVKVFVKISVKITRSEMQVYLWCHHTYGILTSCEVVVEVVSLYPALAEQFLARHHRTHLHPLPFSLPLHRCLYKGNHASVFTPRYMRNASCEIFRIQNSYCDLRVFGTFL